MTTNPAGNTKYYVATSNRYTKGELPLEGLTTVGKY